MTGLNLGFSSNKSSGTEKGSITDVLNELINMQGSQNTDKSSSQSVSGTQLSQGTGSSVGKQSGATASESSSAEQSQTAASTLDVTSLAKLKDSFQGILGLSQASTGGSAQRLAQASNAASNFNLDDFVNSQVDSARVSLDNQRTSATNQLFGLAGGSAGGNTMAALLEGKLASDEAGALAGIKSSATKTGVDTLTQLLASLGGATDSITGQQQALGGLLKGAETLQTGTQTGKTAQTGTTAQDTATMTSEQQSQQSQQLSQLQESIATLLAQLTDTDRSNVQTRDLKTTGKSSGFSAGLTLGKK